MTRAPITEQRTEARRGREGDAMVECDRLVRIYRRAGVEVQALQGLDLLVVRGELTAVIGPSGSGKSTLINIVAGLDTPTAGSVRVAGWDLGALTARRRLAYRRSVVGFVWQQAARNLLPYLTGQENVIMPMRLARTGRREQAARAGYLLDLLQVTHCADRRPDDMSAGERQRVAIATALANRPQLLLADEPTGDLDTAGAAGVLDAIKAVNAELGVTVLIVTHDLEVAAQARRTVLIRNGRTSTETLREDVTDEAGNASQQVVEYAVLDRFGRIQLPREMTQPLGMRDRARLVSEPGHIAVWPDERREAVATDAGQDLAALSASGRARERASGPLIAVDGLSRTFGRGRGAVEALRDVSFTLERGRLAVVYGRSGSGKTTLLNLVGGLDTPDSGTVSIAGRGITGMSEGERAKLRRSTIGFIFQSFALLPILSAAENVEIPLRIAGVDPRDREERVRLLLRLVGLGEHMGQRPDELSGGEQQRVAIARALAGEPELLIADEPTGQLDTDTGRQIVKLIETVVRSQGITALIGTHDPALLDIADQVLRLEDGRLVTG